MLPIGELAHHSQGRTRIRVLSMRHNREYFKSLHEKLGALEGTNSVETNALTGSVIVCHSRPTEVRELAEFARQEHLFELQEKAEANAEPSSNGQASSRLLSDRIPEIIKTVDQRLLQLSDGRVDLRSAAFVGLAGLGLYQISKGRIMPAAISLFDDALSVLKKSSEEIADSKAHP